MLAGIVNSAYAADADQESGADYSKLTDYPAQAINENNWHEPENIREFSRSFELKPTRLMARGKTVYPLEQGEMKNIGKLSFNLPNEKSMTINDAFKAASVDGYIVTKNGKVIYEKYFDGFKEHSFHSWYSASKSILGLAFGHLVEQGKDVRGIRGVLPLINPHPTTKPGEVFAYDNPNVDVIGWITAKVSGVPLAVFLREQAWKNLQTEHDGLLVTDPNYVAQASGGLISTLCDHVRFSPAVANNGKLGDTQVFPEAWVQDTFNYSQENADSFQKHVDEYKSANKSDYSQYGLIKAYKNYWYIIDKDQKAIISRGFAGQFSYVNQESDVTITAFSGQAASQRPDADRLSYFSHLLAQHLK